MHITQIAPNPTCNKLNDVTLVPRYFDSRPIKAEGLTRAQLRFLRASVDAATPGDKAEVEAEMFRVATSGDASDICWPEAANG